MDIPRPHQTLSRAAEDGDAVRVLVGDEKVEKSIDIDSIPTVMRAHQIVGVPYTDAEIEGAAAAAMEQARAMADEVVVQGGPEGLADKQIIALTAYLQRMGTDIAKPEPVAAEEETGEAPADTVVVTDSTAEGDAS